MLRRHGPIGTLIQLAVGLTVVAGVGALTHTRWLLAGAILVLVAASATLLAGRGLDRPGDPARVVTRGCAILAAGTSLVAILAPAALPPLPTLVLGPGLLAFAALRVRSWWALGVATRIQLAWQLGLHQRRPVPLIVLGACGALAVVGALLGVPLTVLPVAGGAAVLYLGWRRARTRLQTIGHLQWIAANATGTRDPATVTVMPSAIDWLAGSGDTIAYASVAPPDGWVPPPAPAAALAGVFAQHGYAIDIDHARRVIGVWHEQAVAPLPDLAAFDGQLAEPGEVRLSVGLDAAELTWDLTAAPHALFTGATGTGKTTVILCAIVQAHSHGFDVWALDPKESEFGMLDGRVERVARGLDECWQALIDAESAMRERQARMREHSVEHWSQVPGLDPILIVVDEAFDLLAAGVRDKERKATRDSAADSLGSIARLGRAPGVHLLAAAQRPDARVLSGELRNNLRCRLLLGTPLQSEALMVLDGVSDLPDVSQGVDGPPPKGRGLLQAASPSAPEVVQCWYMTRPEIEQALPLQDGDGERAGDSVPEAWQELHSPEPAPAPEPQPERDDRIVLDLDDDDEARL